MPKNEIKLDKGFLRAASAPETFNEKDFTMELVVSTGSRGLRHGFFSRYYEELSMEKSSIRMERLQNGAPLLAAHDGSSLDSVIGVVEKAAVREGQLVATVRFSKDEQFRSIVERVKDGIIRKVSVGYLVHRYEELPETEDEIPVFRAVDWEPVEVSLVPVPFDDKAQVRTSEESSLCQITRISKGGNTMTQEELEQKRIADEKLAVENARKLEEEKKAAEQKKTEEVKAAATLERARIAGIQEMATKTNASAELVKELVDGVVPLAEAKERLLNEWAEKGSKVTTQGKVSVGDDKRRASFKEGITNAILHRWNPGKIELTEVGREFRGMSLVDMAKDMMEAAGHNTRGLSKPEVAQLALSREFMFRLGYHATDDFPSLLADVANKTLRQAYQQAPQTFRPFVRFTSAPDFKNINRVQLGEAPALEEVNEHGEYEHGTMEESKETYKVKRYGKIVGFTREAMVNDDLSAFTRIPSLFGAAAANKESDLVYSVLTANAAMGDGVALFHNTHGNLGTTGAISETTLSELRKKARLQTGLDGETLLNIFLRYLVVPAALETIAQKTIAAVIPNATSGVNVFQNAYQVISEPRLDGNSATAWYMMADPSQIDTIELAYLDGQSGVRIESEVSFDTDGMRIKAAHDFGVKAIDHRGMYKNAGA